MAKTAVAVGLMAITAVAQIYSQQQTAKRNASIGERNALMARNASALRADQIREEGMRRLSAIQADAGASGFSEDGSVLDTLFEQARQTERDAQMAMYNGQVEATAALTNSQVAKQEANAASANTLLTTASKIYGAYGSGGGSF